MTTTALLTLSAILLAFLAIVAMMLRRSMNSGEELREELRNGTGNTNDDQEEHIEHRAVSINVPTVQSANPIVNRETAARDVPSTSVNDTKEDIGRGMNSHTQQILSIIFLVPLGLILSAILLLSNNADVKSFTWIALFAYIVVVLTTVTSLLTKRQHEERDFRLSNNPPRKEVIDSLESYLRFVKKEGLVGNRALRNTIQIWKLSRDVYDGKRDIIVDTSFLDHSDVSPDLRTQIVQFKASFDNGIRYESNPVYSRPYRTFSQIAILVMFLLTFGGWLLSKCS